MATSISETNPITDDEDEILSRANVANENDERNYRDSDASSITNSTMIRTFSEFQLSSTNSSRSSGISMPISSLSMVAISSNQSLATPLVNKNMNERKPKHGVKNFFRKILGLSPNSSHQQGMASTPTERLNIDLVHGTAYPSMSPLPITQGPIRLFVLRHGERLDRYYSSQWLQQAFDKDGNFCRFSPILP
jgi:hypothetical protein